MCTDYNKLIRRLEKRDAKAFKELFDRFFEQSYSLALTYVLDPDVACGPCRAAIPHVKELYNKYKDKLNVLSVSLDSDEKPWRKAMEKEQMEWKQLWADKERVNGVKDHYQIKGIPFLLVIDPSGKIAFAGHGPDELSDFLSKNL